MPPGRPPAINAGEIERHHYLLVDPDEIQIDPEFNGRKYSPKIDWLVDQFANFRQIQPIGVRRDESNCLHLTHGHSRLLAAQRLRQMQEDLQRKGEFEGQSLFKVKCILDDETDSDAFLTNLRENMRDDLSPVDWAHNIDRLSQMGLSYREIEGVLPGRKKSWIASTHRLVHLPADLQRKVHAGEISAAAALEALGPENDPQQAAQVFEAAKAAAGENGAVTAHNIREAKAETATEGDKGRGKSASSPRPQYRTSKELAATLEELDLPDTTTGGLIARTLVRWLTTKVGDKALRNVFKAAAEDEGGE